VRFAEHAPRGNPSRISVEVIVHATIGYYP
jgi:hypothetical protein